MNLVFLRIQKVFNLFITYGDTFLPNPSLYDELYYEIIRMHQVFENLYTMALRYTTMPPSTPPPNGESKSEDSRRTAGRQSHKLNHRIWNEFLVHIVFKLSSRSLALA